MKTVIDKLKALLKALLMAKPKPQAKNIFLEAIGPSSRKPRVVKPEGEHMLAVLTDTQQVVVTYGGPVDGKGNPAQVEALTFFSADEATAKFVPGIPDASGVVGPDPATDGKIRGTVVSVAAGVCQVWISADADLGDGVKTIDGEKVDVQVTTQEAVGFGAPTVGTPTEQPTPPAARTSRK